jgi:hypothetical protein
LGQTGSSRAGSRPRSYVVPTGGNRPDLIRFDSVRKEPWRRVSCRHGLLCMAPCPCAFHGAPAMKVFGSRCS